MDVPELSCFHHEWGLHPRYVKDNGGKNGGKNGGNVDGDVVDNVVENKKCRRKHRRKIIYDACKKLLESSGRIRTRRHIPFLNKRFDVVGWK